MFSPFNQANDRPHEDSVVVYDAGRGETAVSTYGNAVREITMPAEHTGMTGLASLYPRTVVVDASYTAWNGPGTYLMGNPGDAMPVPETVAVQLGGDGHHMQPRPGTMPGLYILQVGDDYYHYGGPLESGANPQTTAHYKPNLSFAPPPYLSNQLSGAQLWPFPGYIEVRHVDGSIARFDSFNPYTQLYTPSPSRTLWRLTWVRDPYDNQTNYVYNSFHQLVEIRFPSGLTQHLDYSPSWAWSGVDCLEIRYTQNGSTPPEAAARTWGLVFAGVSPGNNRRYFGGRLYRAYSAPRAMLADLSTQGYYTNSPGSQVTGQVVHEFVYDSIANPPALREYQRVHTGVLFAQTLTTPIDLQDRLILETAFASVGASNAGCVVSQIRSMTAEMLTVTYPAGNWYAAPVSSMAGIEVANSSGTTRRYEFDTKSGRLITIITTPSLGFEGRPRANHVTSENSGIAGVAATDVEPTSIIIHNIYDSTCVCQKPIKREEIAVRGGPPVTRTWNFEYDPISKLVTKRTAPNPEAGAGPFSAQVEWTYTYTRAHPGGSSQLLGAWLPDTEVTPDGTYTYEYGDPQNRLDANHGNMPRTTQRRLAGVRIQDTLAGNPSISAIPVVELVWRNLANLPPSLPQMGTVNGQLRKVVDGDGVETIFEYTASGHLNKTIASGDIQTSVGLDALGNVTSVVANATSAVSATTTLQLMAGIAVPTSISSTSGGLLRQSQAYYDRFGHLTVVRQNNLSSAGTKPNKHGSSGAQARDWVETQYHYHHTRLMEIYRDRKPLDEAAGGAQFLVTQLTYSGDGRLETVLHPNGSKTTHDFDGFGTLYRSLTRDPSNTQTVRSPKIFVNEFLEVTGSYEHAGGTDHLWTLITRNAAGAITEIHEPAMTSAPPGYTSSLGGAIHRYEIDKLGRVTKAVSLDGTNPLTSRELRHDQLNRQIWQRDLVLGFGSGDHHTAWRYYLGKESQLASVERTGIAPTTYSFYASGLLAQVRDGFSTGNIVDYAYHNKTAFVAQVTRTDLDPLGAPLVTSTAYDVDPFGRISEIRTGTPQLVHRYDYNSLGGVDRYGDPMGRVQRFLPDALGRVVEHVREGSGAAFILNAAVFEDFGAADGRTKERHYDGLAATSGGHVTITHRDFAGRPFIVQNPGGNTAPTASSPNQSMCLYAEYDGASRLASLYDGEQGKTRFWRDGPGRTLQRQLEGYTGDKIAVWNTKDVIRRDAIGRIQQTDYWGAASGGVNMGVEQFDQDSLGRVHSARFASAFAPAHTLKVESSFNDASSLRSELGYADNMAMESAHMTYSHDAIGRLAEVQWDKAPGA
ncbi:MAG: hypothetical protein ABIP94_04010, partial [Planctomycetota bacterium]